MQILNLFIRVFIYPKLEVINFLTIELLFCLYFCNFQFYLTKKLFFIVFLTRKKSHVDPWNNVPYCTSVCDAKSSGELIGVTIRSTVKNAAKLAVYDDIKISVKNHQTEPTIRPDIERGDMSHPCCINAPSANQKELKILNSLTVAEWVLAPTPPPPPPPPPDDDSVCSSGSPVLYFFFFENVWIVYY